MCSRLIGQRVAQKNTAALEQTEAGTVAAVVENIVAAVVVVVVVVIVVVVVVVAVMMASLGDWTRKRLTG